VSSWGAWVDVGCGGRHTHTLPQHTRVLSVNTPRVARSFIYYSVGAVCGPEAEAATSLQPLHCIAWL
jgi:hypothetical protein